MCRMFDSIVFLVRSMFNVFWLTSNLNRAQCREVDVARMPHGAGSELARQ